MNERGFHSNKSNSTASRTAATGAAKIAAMLFLFVWVRWTLPRLKYDLLMKLGWKVFLPLALLNIVIVALLIPLGWL